MSIRPCSINKSGYALTFDAIKDGKHFNDFDIPGFKVHRNYFDCAEYYYDGTFNVVRFKKGMTIYHGSARLANANVEFPAGKDFYDERNGPKLKQPQYNDQNESVTYNIIRDSNYRLPASWYSDIETSKIYSNIEVVDEETSRLREACGDKCRLSFKVKEDIVMFLLEDDYNIAKLLYSDNEVVPPIIKDYIRNMFSIEKDEPIRTYGENPFNRFYYEKDRVSDRTWDLPFAEWACENIVNKIGYAGYCSSAQPSTFHGDVFHLEFIFCNPFRYLVRNLDDPEDWQYRNRSAYPPKTGLLLDSLSLYETLNVNFHAGNLLEHSIWSLLWAEYLMNTKTIDTNTENFDPRIAGLVSLLHDIGKLTLDDQKYKLFINPVRKKIIYFDIDDHPVDGFKMILNDNIMYSNIIYDADGFIDDVQRYYDSLNDVIVENNINGNVDLKYIKLILAFVSNLHWNFGGEVLANRDPKVNIDQYVILYINKCVYLYRELLKHYSIDSSYIDFPTIMIYLLLTSISDIYAAQPVGVGKLTSELNIKSKLFPYINNMPKVYSGKNTFIDFNMLNANTIANQIIDYVRTRKDRYHNQIING